MAATYLDLSASLCIPLLSAITPEAWVHALYATHTLHFAAGPFALRLLAVVEGGQDRAEGRSGGRARRAGRGSKD